MKKHAIAIAVGSLFALPAVALAGGPTVYGKVNVSYENIKENDNKIWDLQSNDSRLGVKGSFDLDARDLSAIYGLEFGADVAEGGDSALSQRNIYGGLQHATMGTFKVGKFDTPFKKAQGSVDQFGDLAGDIKTIAAGENRVSNILQYTSPKLGEMVTVNLAVMPGEDREVNGDRDGPADSISSSLVFDNGTFYGALAYDSEVSDKTFDSVIADLDDNYVDAFRAVGMMNMGNFEFGGLVQTAESSEDHDNGKTYEDTTTLVSGAYNVDRWKFKAQYGVTDLDQTDDELGLMAFGADYKIGKASKLFGYYADVDQDQEDDEDKTHVGLGFEHKFSM
ncbi:MAG: porin [Desulfovibrionales bacterium]